MQLFHQYQIEHEYQEIAGSVSTIATRLSCSAIVTAKFAVKLDLPVPPRNE
ncbi:MAG: hypothetical protein KatS3mg066_1978 [Fischerella sp.]|nr:MAG: hypothetical protein KatS3mg066_1978 [Fischerella sp.]